MGTARAFRHYEDDSGVIDISNRQEIIDGHSNIWYKSHQLHRVYSIILHNRLNSQ